MKKFILFITILMLIGMAGAVTITGTSNLKNFGAPNGFKNAGTIQASDLYATDDMKVGDDAQVVGDLTVTGALAYGSGNFSSGTYDDNLRLLANHSFWSTAGSGTLDWTNGTGGIRAENIISSDDGLIYDYLNLARLKANTSIYSAGTLNAAGTATVNKLNNNGTYSGTVATLSGAMSSGGAVTGASIVDNGTATFAGKVYANSNLAVVGTAQVSGTTTVNKLNNNGTYSGTAATLSGAMSAGGAVTGATVASNGTGAFAGVLSANGRLQLAENASTSVSSTVLTSASTKSIYGIDASGANATLTLPDAATVPGGIYPIAVSGNPGSNYARVTATGGDLINGKAYLVSTDQYSTAMIFAYGGAYYAVTTGTWAQHA